MKDWLPIILDALIFVLLLAWFVLDRCNVYFRDGDK
jgi:hypothetical protein